MSVKREAVILGLDSFRARSGLPETDLQRNRRLVPGMDPHIVQKVFDRAERVGSERNYQMIKRGPLEMRTVIREVSSRRVS